VFDHLKQQLAAVSRTPNNLDLFVIGLDNHVWSTFWPDANGHWNSAWFPLPGNHVFDNQKQQVAAVARRPDILDLFVIGFDNHVYSTFWTGGGGWNQEWFPLPGQHVFDHQTQNIAAVSRAPDILDLFVIGFDNKVYSTFWTQAGGWNQEWFPLPGQHVFDHRTQQVAVVSRQADVLDLFVIGFDNKVYSTFWTGGGGWNQEWFPLPGQHVFDHQTQELAAVSRTPGNLDLFVLGFDNHAYSTFWGPHAPAITLHAIQDGGRFIEVTGRDFTPIGSVTIGYDITSGGGPTTHQTGEEVLTSDGAGRFVHRIRVNLAGDISGATAQATDVATNTIATGLLPG